MNGCGNSGCCNEHCASSGRSAKLSNNEAAAMALDLFKKKATLCESAPTKQLKTGDESPDEASMESAECPLSHTSASGARRMSSKATPSTSSTSPVALPSTSSASSLQTRNNTKSHKQRNSSVSDSKSYCFCTVWGPIMGRVQLMGIFHSFALIVNSLIN